MLHGFPHVLFAARTGLEQGLEECGGSFDFWSIGGCSFRVARPMGMTALAAETGVMGWRLFAEIEHMLFACYFLGPSCVPVPLPSWPEDVSVERQVDRRWQRCKGCQPFFG